jgi:hypothetical protein
MTSMTEEALADERITDAQRTTLARLTDNGVANVSFALYHAPDSWLMAGYLEVEVRGITYGIAPNGDASS